MSKKFIKNREGCRRDQGFVNYVMRRRREDAWALLERAKAQHRAAVRYLATVVPQEVMAEYCWFLRQEASREWEEMTTRMKRKVTALEEKHLPWRRPVQPKIKDVKITDEELEPMERMEKKVEVPVYGEVEVPPAAREALLLPPKFALYPKIDMKSVETEVQRGICKARWEHRS
jgi:hypothetical protein